MNDVIHWNCKSNKK